MLDTYLPTAESFRGKGGDVNASYFNDTMESYKCGKNAAANVCDVIYSAKEIPDEVHGGTKLELKCAERSLSTTAPGEGNPDYHRNKNLASAVILYPAEECLTMYTMYEGDNCHGRSKSSHISYETEEALKAAIGHFD